MKLSFAFSLMSLISLSVCVRAQELSRVTLYSAIGLYDRTGDYDLTRSSFNFETGKSELHRENLNGILMDNDIDYDQTETGANRDLFEVRDWRSMIVDLGKKGWEQFKETPSFPRGYSSVPPRPMTREFRLHSRDTEVTSNWRQFVKVRSGHMYLMRLLKGNK